MAPAQRLVSALAILTLCGSAMGCSIISATDGVYCTPEADSCVSEATGPAEEDPAPEPGETPPQDDPGEETPPPTEDTPMEEPMEEPRMRDEGAGGCVEASGECDEWEAELASRVARVQRMNGCDAELSRDPRLDEIAAEHAAHQAAIGMMDPDTRSIFDAVYASDIEIYGIAAAFSVTGAGPEDVIERWLMNGRTGAILRRCDSVAGVGIATSEDDESYITLILAY